MPEDAEDQVALADEALRKPVDWSALAQDRVADGLDRGADPP
jgi:hypothetical protein